MLISAVTLTNTTPSNAITTISTSATNSGVDSNAATTVYPLGDPDSSEPSGYAPPDADAMSGYALSYSNDFTGTTLPAGWEDFAGTPSGDPGSLWASSQVTISGGMVQLTTSPDSASTNGWVSGGVGQIGNPLTYGAFFVRSRMTGIGPTQVELLWPVAGWPPEIDFDETYGGDTSEEATLHYTSTNLEIHNELTIDMTQWHTWGVVWTPDSIIYTVDGNEWDSVTTPADIPDQPMNLDIQQQTWCESGFACPTASASTDGDWVTEYSPTSSSSPPPTTTTTTSTTTTTTTNPPTTTTTVTGAPSAPGSPPSAPSSPPVTASTPNTTTTTTANVVDHPSDESLTLNSFATNSTSLSHALRSKIARLAAVIRRDNDSEVILTGYSSVVRNRSEALAIARARAASVDAFLQERLARLDVSGVKIIVRGAISGGASVTASVRSRSVVALLR